MKLASKDAELKEMKDVLGVIDKLLDVLEKYEHGYAKRKIDEIRAKIDSLLSPKQEDGKQRAKREA